MKHYDKAELELYRNREMSVLGRINCAAHLKKCPECAARLKELEKEDSLLVELRESVSIFDRIARGYTPGNTTAAAK